MDDNKSQRLDYIEELIKNNERIQKELLWANIFRDTINGSKWLKEQSFSFGRWAIGYPCAYVIYRALLQTRPKNILEIGLGESTKITSQYAKHYPSTKHTVIENDQVWMRFFANQFKLSETTDIKLCDIDYKKYKDDENVRIYKNFKNIIADQKYDFIFIDGPWGGDAKKYSRIDVIDCIPACLPKNFIIIFDDIQREPEKRVFEDMIKKLNDAHIKCLSKIYSGEKSTGIICTEKNKFLISL